MLISFSVENLYSYKEMATFTMVASQEKQHKERLPYLEDYKLRLLPVASIYGGNASGKTNFFKALNFAKGFIVNGLRPDARIPVESYKLSSDTQKGLSRCVFELYLDGKCYEYGFALNSHEVVEEWLVLILKTTERELFRRRGDEIEFEKKLDKDQFLHFAFRGTRGNELFLTNSVQQKVLEFEAIYKWFRDSLVLIAPDTRFAGFEHFVSEGTPLYNDFNRVLSSLDTGVSRIGGEEVAFKSIPLPEDLKGQVQADLKDNETVRVAADNGDRFVISRSAEGELIAKKLVTYHLDDAGEEVQFEISQESDGTKRVINLLPVFLELAQEGKCYVIDELDRSLHSLLTRQLIESYLLCCNKDTRSQLLITTHDLSLMDQSLFRRDEMWAVERDAEGSHFSAFSDYKVIRYDKDLRKSYLQGRFGGVPRLTPLVRGEKVGQ